MTAGAADAYNASWERSLNCGRREKDIMELSILDIAKRAGVSKSTVSRVINGGSASPKTRELIEHTMQEMGYYPNYMARGLRGVHNTVVGILSLGRGMFTNPAISRRVAGILDTLSENGCDLLIVQDSNPHEAPGYTPKYVRYLRQQRIQGLITLGWDDLPEVQQAANQFRNVVYGGERLHANRGFRVYHGNYNYSSDLYRLLVMNGHRRVLTLVGVEPQNEQFRKTRLRAWENICFEAGFACSAADFYPAPAGGNATAEYLEALYKYFMKGKYTAVFADELACARAVRFYFQERGLRCPQDFSIVTIQRDDTEERFLTSAFVSDYEYGVLTTKLMLEVIQNKELEYRDVMMSYSMELRRSVGQGPV